MTDYATAKYLSKYCSREVNTKCLFTSYNHLFPIPIQMKKTQTTKNSDNKNCVKENLKPSHLRWVYNY